MENELNPLRIKKGDIISWKHFPEADAPTFEGKVQWVIDDEFSMTGTMSSGYSMAKFSEVSDLKIIYSAAPTYQSTVATMSDEELRASIDGLRVQRAISTPKVRKERSATSRALSPIEKALAAMTPEQQAELKKKMGMID